MCWGDGIDTALPGCTSRKLGHDDMVVCIHSARCHSYGRGGKTWRTPEVTKISAGLVKPSERTLNARDNEHLRRRPMSRP
jgi:hypothetical protein